MIRNNLVHHQNKGKKEGKIGLFNSYACSVEWIAKFHDHYELHQVATTQNQVIFYACDFK